MALIFHPSQQLSLGALESSHRSIDQFPIGNVSLRSWQEKTFSSLNPSFDLHCLSNAWLSQTLIQQLISSPIPSGVFDNESQAWLAWNGTDTPSETTQKITTDETSQLIRFAWQLLNLNQQILENHLKFDRQGTVHAQAVIDGNLNLGKGSHILPGVYIEGNVSIGENCKIGPNCCLRGNTSIGDYCHIGQSVEVKNSLILSQTNIGHLSYVGDSILGENVNLGAGTITANLRHDNKSVKSYGTKERINTQRIKLGAIIGDHVKTAIQTGISPGRQLWSGTVTHPGQQVSADFKNN